MKHWICLAIWASFALADESRAAAQDATSSVPEALEPWKEWAMRDAPAYGCLPLPGRTTASPGGEAICAWPSELTLRLEDDGASFEQLWFIERKRFVSLPGGSEHEPFDVEVDGNAALLSRADGAMRVELDRGAHRVSGRFRWLGAPEWLQVDPQTGHAVVRDGNQKTSSPKRDENGRIWIRSSRERDTTKSAPAESGLAIAVFRKVSDGVPLVVETLIELRVGGAAREERIASPQLPGLKPMFLESPLPAALDESGMRVRVLPGVWRLRFKAQTGSRLSRIEIPKQSLPWASREIWVFEPAPELRQVELRGLASIDPTQTRLPEDWKKLTAYEGLGSQSLKFEELRRGGDDTALDALHLSRDMWLDLDGAGATISDKLTGQMRATHRLVMGKEAQLGRISIHGQDAVITRIQKSGGAGVELQHVNLQVSADSRFEGSAVKGWPIALPAVAWQHDVKSLRTSFHFGPGWLLFHVGGADDASETWIGKWTLLDLFMLLLISLAASRLWGLRWGLFLGLTLVLTLTEAGAPTWLWAVLLAFEGVAWALSRGKGHPTSSRARERSYQVIKVLWWIPFLALMLVSLAYSLDEIRFAINPSSELDAQDSSRFEAGAMQVANNNAPAMKPSPHADQSGIDQAGADHAEVEEDEALEESAPGESAGAEPTGTDEAKGGEAGDGPQDSLPQQSKARKRRIKTAGSYGSWNKRFSPQGQNAQAAVQTGPGLPQWAGNSATLTWNGPVTQHEILRLWMIPPFLSRCLAALRVGLLFSLILFLIRRQFAKKGKHRSEDPNQRSQGPNEQGPDEEATPDSIVPSHLALGIFVSGTFILGILLCSVGSFFAPTIARADIPPKKMLEDLQKHLGKPPACRPQCAALGRVEVRVEGDRLLMRLRVSAQAPSAFPLPGRAETWLPDMVLLDGKKAAGLLQRDKRLYIRLPRGAYKVEVQGTLQGRDALSIPMNAKSPVIEFLGGGEKASGGWQIEGQQSGSGSTLSLRRIQRISSDEGSASGTSIQGKVRTGPLSRGGRSFPPLLRVTHTFSFGLTWEKTTRVERLTPLGSSIAFSMKLLPGESILTEGIEVGSGRVRAALEADASTLEWRSSLRKSSGFVLAAEDSGPLLHEWILSASPIWHIDFKGIQALHRKSSASTWRFLPWRGEELRVSVTKPEIAKGSTRTFDHGEIGVTPGSRSTELRLKLEVRSSRGGALMLKLPKGARGESLFVDGEERPMQLSGQKLNIASRPGSQHIELRWREPQGVSVFTSSPGVAIGSEKAANDVANIDIEVTPGAGRWVLFTGGPGMGPSVMFWAALLLVAIASLALGRISFVPLRHYQWFLFGIGLTQGPLWLSFILIGWFLAVGLRGKHRDLPWWAFSSFQMLLLAWTLVALGGLIGLVGQGLLGDPEMQIIGNGSSSDMLRWTTARTPLHGARSWFVSVPILVYRALMLAWALWLAFSFLKWAKWATAAFTRGGILRLPPGFAPPFRNASAAAKPGPSPEISSPGKSERSQD